MGFWRGFGLDFLLGLSDFLFLALVWASLPRLPLLLAFLPFLSIPASNSQARRPPVPAAAAAAVPPLPSRRLPPLRRHPSSRTQGNQRLSRVIAPRGVGRREGDPATLQGIVTAVIWKHYIQLHSESEAIVWCMPSSEVLPFFFNLSCMDYL